MTPTKIAKKRTSLIFASFLINDTECCVDKSPFAMYLPAADAAAFILVFSKAAIALLHVWEGINVQLLVSNLS